MEPPQPAELDHAEAVLRLLAERTRLAILAMLREGEMTVTQIAETLDRPIPAISQHLARLRTGGLVRVRREGSSSYYSQPDVHLTRLVTEALHFAEHGLYDVPPHHRDVTASADRQP